MKIFLFLLLLIFSGGLFSQTIPGYQNRQVREKLIAFAVDSGLHIPRYNGTPSGVRTGVYVADGAIALDTTNHRFYIYSGGAWIPLASFSEIVGVADTSAMLTPYLRGATAGYGMLITGSQHKTWTVDSFSLASRARVQKGIDSIAGLISGATTIYTGDGTLAGNRQVTMDGKSLSFINSGENKLVVNPVSDSYSLGDGDGAAANINISSSTYSTNFSGVNFSKFTYTGRQWLIGDVDDNWDGIKIQMDNSGVTKYGSLTFGDSTHILIDDGNHYFKFLTRESERVRLNESGILIPNGVMPTSGSGGTDSAWFRNSSTGQTYLAPGGGGGISAADLPLRITGSTVSADTSVAYNPSLTTNARTQQILDSLQAAGWGNQSINNDYKYYVDMSNNTWANGFFASVGTGSSALIPSTPIAAGWWSGRELKTGTTNTGRGYFILGNNNYTPIAISTSYRYSCGARVRFEDLSDVSETYGFFWGFGDDANSYASIVDGIGFRYDYTDSSGQFIAWTKSNSSTTEVATGITVAADTDYTLQITGIGGSFYFYINGVLKATISTNIPTGTTRWTSLVMSINKSAGTTSRSLYINWVGYDWREN